MEKNNHNYSIGVVTYINRYHTYFKKNIESLAKYFPDKQIICIINGHPDKVRNIAYLKEITSWLSTFNNVKYVTFEDHQSLAKCWNWILLMSSTENNLFLNDDISVKQKFRQDFESHLADNLDFFAINNSFSHFLLNKKVVKKIGWFDERFLGVGYEDGDYLIRLAQGGIDLVSVTCRDIVNFIAKNYDPGFKEISTSMMNDKYSSVNGEFMRKKWFFNHLGDVDFGHDIEFFWNDQEYLVKLKDEMATPVFYSYELLDNNLRFSLDLSDISDSISDIKKTFKSYLKSFFKVK
ncbi:MAG: hypothetical protein WCK59_01875 [Candidatus Falkowbacteria bacterium]